MSQADIADKPKETGAENVRWDLKELYGSVNDPKIEEDLKKAQKLSEEFVEKYKNIISDLSVENLKKAFEDLEALLAPLYQMHQYASLVYSTDTSNGDAKKLKAKLDEAFSHISNEILFFDLELGKISEEKYKQFINSDILDNYRYSIYKTYKDAKYYLSEKEEQVMNLKDLTGVKAFRKLYSDLTNGFQFEFEIDGVKKKMNGSELRALRYHKSADVRRRAMKMFFERYEDNENIISSIFNNIVKNHAIEKNLRKYDSAISVMNVGNDLDDEVVQVLHDVTTESYKLVHRYYKLKAKILKLDDMTLADIYAPLPTANETYSFDKAKDIVLEGFSAFDEEFYSMAKSMFDENRIDAPVLPTKRGGAFCSSSTPDLKPYVLLNFLGRARDVSTMAHELGHAIHDMFASEQTLMNQHPILPLAETASVFSEMIITDLLLKKITDPLARQSLLTDKLEDIFATSHRQNMFSRFEMASHKGISERLMSSEELCQIYEQEIKMMFGDSVNFTDEYRWEWSSIPHIFEVPFYVYAYNFANLLVMALYQQYLNEGKSFIPRLKGFLKSGGSKSPVEITEAVNINIKDPDFWKQSFVYVEGLIDELERLIEK